MHPHDASLIDELGQKIAYDNAVLFVGTALRKELGEHTTLEQLADALAAQIDYQDADRTFTSVATEYERKLDSHGLIQAIKAELGNNAEHPAPIHQLLARLIRQQPGTKVITTRFDHLLERALEQQRKRYMVLIGEHDVPYFDESKIILIKVRGDIDQPDTLVLTEKDREDFLDQLPALSDVIRALLATKTLIFLGYDLESAFFRQFFRRVRPKVAGHHRRAYLVVGKPPSDKELGYWQDENVEICSQNIMGFLEDLVRATSNAAERPWRQKGRLPVDAPALPERPYKALQSFKATDQQVFKGRVLETLRLVNRILGHPHAATVVYGESGSGKSSLLQAGVGPELRRRQSLFAYCVAEPGRSLSTLLGQALAQAGEPFGLQPTDNSIVETLRNWHDEFDGPAVLAVDQFEQYLLALNAEEREKEIHLLRDLLSDRSVDLRLVLALREDFLGRLQIIEDLIPGVLDVRFRLEYLGREAAREAIEEPARLFGVTWESELVDTLLDDLYEGVGAGVLPPQLQIVCDRLYSEAVEQSTDSNKNISLALFQRLGGTMAILGDYLDREVAKFTVDEQPVVWLLLGQMVGSSQIKQRLSLDELARAADLTPEAAESILDQLTQQRLVQRYEVTKNGHDQARLEYELTHDYLVARIANRTGDEFWAKQKAWEIVRRALPEWQEWSILPAPDDLRLIEQQLSSARFSKPEAEMLYAAAISHEENPAPWQQLVAASDRRSVLLVLMQRKDAFVRGQAARALAEFSDSDTGKVLARAAVEDPVLAVQTAAVETIAHMVGQAEGEGGKTAVAYLAEVAAQPATQKLGQHALEGVWDLEPTAQGLVPRKLQRPIHRGVWRRRWLRTRYEILSSTTRGAQGGFWGLSLSLGPLLGYIAWATQAKADQWQSWIGAMVVAMPLAGVLGAVVGGLNALGWTASSDLGHRDRPWSTWAVMTLVSALAMGLGFLLLVPVASASIQSALAMGLWIGLGLVGAATLPLGLPRRYALALTVLVGMLTFAVISVATSRQSEFKVGDPLPGDFNGFHVSVQLVEYTPPNGNPGKGRGEVSTQSGPGTGDPELEIENASLQFAFDTAVSKLYFCAFNEDDDYIVKMNEEKPFQGTSADFSDLHNRVIAGATTTVRPCPSNSSSQRIDVMISGDASQKPTFTIGGRMLRISTTFCPEGTDIDKCFSIANSTPGEFSGNNLPGFLAMGAISGLGFFLGLGRNSRNVYRRRKSP